MIITNQINESQLQLNDFYMNIIMKLTLNIATEYKLFLKKKVNMKRNSIFI